jgi:hypothetical protein
MGSELDDLITQAAFLAELHRVRNYMETAPEAYMRLDESYRADLEHYYSLDRPMPDPDAHDDPVGILVAWRDEAVAEDPALAERVEVIRGHLDSPETEFSYLELRRRVLDYIIDHQERFRRLRERDLRTLDRYFLISDSSASTDPLVVLDHSKTVERVDAGIRRRVLKLLEKVDGFEA